MTDKRVKADHGTVCRLTHDPNGYFGWPTVARLTDGTLVAASSGLRTAHVCPFGKTVLHTSQDSGQTWSDSRVIQDSLIDDRDAGVVAFENGGLLVSWFRSDTRIYRETRHVPDEARRLAASIPERFRDARHRQRGRPGRCCARWEPDDQASRARLQRSSALSRGGKLRHPD